MQDFATTLHRSGFRATPGRIALLKVLAHESQPLTTSEVGKRLKGRLDTVTLYRALEAFEQTGTVRRVEFGHGHAHWELQQKHHHHLVCRTCGAVEDVPVCISPRLEKQIMKKSSMFESIYSHNLEFFGCCKKCAEAA